MNKYEIRAESVLQKREEYYLKCKKRNQRILTASVVSVCATVVLCTVFALKHSVQPLPVIDQTKNWVNITLTQAYVSPGTYDGMKIFVDSNEKNYGDFKTCYVNSSDEENPYNELNSFGVLTSDGEIVVPPVYSSAVSAGDNCFIVERTFEDGTREAALIDSQGKIIFEYFRGNILPIYFENKIYVLIADAFEGADYLIKPDGTKALDIEFQNLFYSYTAVSEQGFEPEEMIKGIYNDEYYLINYKGEISGIYNKKPKVKKPFGQGMNLMAAYKLYQGNYKTLLFGVSDSDGNEIVPCYYNSIYYTGDRIVVRRGDEQGLGESDVVMIYDNNGNIVCDKGIFCWIDIEYGAETGIGTAVSEWDDEIMATVGGYWVIDKNGKKISDEYDKITKNNDGTYTAHYDRYSKTHILDKNGIILE